VPSLEVIRFRDIIRADKISLARDGSGNPLLPTTVALRGDDFTSADVVSINDMKVPSFIIMDKHTIWAELPPNTLSIDSVSVVSSKFTKTAEASLVKFQVGEHTRTTSGLLKLSQLFIKWLLQTPGSDIFNPERGGGVQAMIGTAYSTKNMDPILAGLTQAVTKTTEEIQQAQLFAGELPLAERLLSTRIMDLNVVGVLMEARVRIQVVSMAGADAVSSLSL